MTKLEQLIEQLANFGEIRELALYHDSSVVLKTKDEYHKLAKRVLKELANALGLASGTYDVSSNKGGIAVAGEITLHGEDIYVQIQQDSAVGKPVMYRACDGRKDYRGKCNNFCGIADLANPELHERMRTLKALYA